MIIVTGLPKSGTHALALGLELLGLPSHRQHIEFGRAAADIAIIRDPRDVLVSWLRMQKKPVTTGTLIAAMRNFDGRPYSDALAAYEGWIPVSVRYESLIQSDVEMRWLADRFDVGYIDGAWECLMDADTPTKTQTASRWTDYVNPVLTEVWDDIMGTDTLSKWGYK